MSVRLAPEGRSSTSSPEEELFGGNRKGARSPLAASRLEEKEELQDLNDRLSRYIEYIQQNLFGAGSVSELNQITRSVKGQLDDLSNLYADELDAARKSLDSIALQLTNCQVKLKSAQSDRDEAQKELETMRARDKRSANEIATLSAELSRLESELERCHHLKRDHDDLLKQHAIVKEQLEKETIMRTDWQNRVLTLTEQLEFKDRLLEKERETWSTEAIQIQMRTVATEAEKYRNKLKQKLDELRDEMADQLDELQCKMQTSVKAKLDAEQSRTQDAEGRAQRSREECNRLSTVLASRSSELLTCRKEMDMLRRTVEQLNATLRDLEDKHRAEMDRNHGELARLLELVDAKSLECAELAGIKVQLDAEIAMYRSLLESEESRCHLSPSKRQMTSKPIFTNTRTVQSTEKTVKRPFPEPERDVDIDAIRDDAVVIADHIVASKAVKPLPSRSERDKHSTSFDEVFTRQTSDKALRITCSADGPVHFASADPGDGLLRICNASDETVNLNQWQLHFGPTRPGTTDYATLHVFGESQKLNPHAELRVHLCPSKGDQVNRIPAKKTRRQHMTSLFIVTELPVWDPYTSLVTLQDADGVVRAVCEIEPLGSTRKEGFWNHERRRSTVRSIRVTCTATGDVHFESVESGKGILSLCNAGKETFNLTGWRVDFECPGHKVSTDISSHRLLKPREELRIHLCHPSDKSVSANSDDAHNLWILTDAPSQDYYNSSFTLHDANGVVRAISKIERIAPGEEREDRSISGSSDASEATEASAETSDESDAEEEDIEPKIEPLRRQSGNGFDAAFYTRHRQFLESSPLRHRNPCGCPLM